MKSIFIKIVSAVVFLISLNEGYAFSYHNNDIYFQAKDDIKILRVTYKMLDHSITDKQDPDRKIVSGRVYGSSVGAPYIRFEVGRKKSNTPADWLKSHLNMSERTTFGHLADNLNFAFKGNLEITTDTGIYVFDDIYLAQGRSGATNNWWFGGNKCNHYQQNHVICVGKFTPSGEIEAQVITLDFQRGGVGNSSDQVTVKVSSKEACFYNSSNDAISLAFSLNNSIFIDDTLRSLDSHCIGTSENDQLEKLKIDNYSFGALDQSKTDDTETKTLPLNNNTIEISRGNGITLVTFIKDNKSNPQLRYSGRNWMSSLSDKIPLNKIVIPGSHDSGMSVANNMTFAIKEKQVITQNRDVKGQLEAGARFFDIRPSIDHGKLVTQHRTYLYLDSVGANGQEICEYNGNGINNEQVLEQVSQFLRSNPSETVLLKFSHFRYDNHGSSENYVDSLVDTIRKLYGDQLYIALDYPFQNLTDAVLRDLRGKMVILFSPDDQGRDYELKSEIESNINHRDIFLYKNYQKDKGVQADLAVYDKYTGKEQYKKIEKDQLGKFEVLGQLGQNYLFLLSWTATTSGDIAKYYPGVHAHLPNNLLKMRNRWGEVGGNKERKLPNIVYIDFVNPYINQSIIALNFLGSKS